MLNFMVTFDRTTSVELAVRSVTPYYESVIDATDTTTYAPVSNDNLTTIDQLTRSFCGS